MFDDLVNPTKQPWKGILYVSAFVKHHEKLLAVILAAALIWGVVGKVQDAIAAHDKAAYAAAASVTAAQAEKNAALATASAALAQQAQAQATATAAANKQLEASNAALITALANQRAIDAKLSPPELAARIETLAALPPNSVVPATAGYTVTAPAAVSIAQSLETVSTQAGEIVNLKSEAANDRKQIAAQDALVLGLNQQIAGLGLQIGDQTKECKAQVATVKAEARKSKMRWFKAGVVVGFVAGVVTMHYIP
jgi:hypothetical protein